MTAFKGGFRVSCYICGRCMVKTGRFVIVSHIDLDLPKMKPEPQYVKGTAQLEACEECFMDVASDVLRSINELTPPDVTSMEQEFNSSLLAIRRADLPPDQDHVENCCGACGVVGIKAVFYQRVANYELRPLLPMPSQVKPDDPAGIKSFIGCEKCFLAKCEEVLGGFSRMADENPRFDANAVQKAVKNMDEFPYCGKLSGGKNGD